MTTALYGGNGSKRRVPRGIFRAGSLIAGVVLVASLIAASGAVAAPELADITVYTELSFQSPVQLITAQKKGFFKQFGLNVNAKYYQSASDVPPGMIGGSIVLAHGGLANALVVADQGFPVKVISVVADWARSGQLIVQKDMANLSPGDLAGKTLVGPDIPVMKMFWLNWAAHNKIDPKSVKWLNAAPSDALAAFVGKRADMLLVWAPFTTNAVKAGGVMWQDGRTSYRTGAAGPAVVYLNWGVVFASADWVKKYPRTVEAYLSGLYMAHEYIQCHREEVASLVTAEARIDPAVGPSLMSLNTYQMGMGAAFMEEAQKYTNFFQQVGVLKRAHNFRDIADSATLDKVIKTTTIPASFSSCVKK